MACLYFLDAFKRIVDSPVMDDDTVRGALGFIVYLEDLEFMFFLFTFKAIFALTDVVLTLYNTRQWILHFVDRQLTIFFSH